ncbi:50S ribosomal protein L25/general stress protein Ctc [Salisediminibacterium halotolerans]|uniref:50S ribosomal protein L25/general stress protein Ctc n=1 Tax=Salisediminibacterium halotolerans TaxID=517425 RepID=UPI000EB1DEAE|nr:50S ribosomal protein L25/general stress protein Ctc [Salisediminibacterium halotolerans]RLJ80952.1 LSU ribosomal protein L25P [Actinophytocola xinjiangensis]RPE83643.1 LSU ribosomal protein L25P [Salisediminibacterium halotolerans]TWG37877.1 large subunit ribosomal protein L25 [Salisediminibacterium halotolerans]GEL07009.1 50S ribosomal protein L25 [Salisediminibacterium halotolerans]
MVSVLKANVRENFKDSARRETREKGYIPAVIYGKKYGNTPVAVETVEFIKTYRNEGKTGVFKLDVDGTQTDVMIYDMQYDTMKNEVVHVDFYAADMTVEMDADVPVHIQGEAQGVKDGGVLQQAVYELSVRALPKEIPDAINVDVTELEIGDTVAVGDLKSGAKFEFNAEEDEAVVTVVPPTEEPEETVDVEEEEEPELVDEEAEAKDDSDENEG